MTTVEVTMGSHSAEATDACVARSVAKPMRAYLLSHSSEGRQWQ